MSVIKFAHDYPIERERVFKTLESCKNKGQLETTKRYFNALKQKWVDAIQNNITIKLMVDTDENRFLSNLKQKETIFE
jgi:hypothetical protein